jgi:hypothetical protein
MASGNSPQLGAKTMTAFSHIDHPHIRSKLHCPVCYGGKDAGAVVCWPCYRRYGMRNGNPTIERILDRYETGLATRNIGRVAFKSAGAVRTK